MAEEAQREIVKRRSSKCEKIVQEEEAESFEDSEDMIAASTMPHRATFAFDQLNFNQPKTCWQKLEDYVWLENHEYFYICCIHEYYGLLRKSSPKMLILIRLVLFVIMLAHGVYDLIREGTPKMQEFRYWSMFLTILVTFLNLLCAFQYKRCLSAFELKLNKSLVDSQIMDIRRTSIRFE